MATKVTEEPRERGAQGAVEVGQLAKEFVDGLEGRARVEPRRQHLIPAEHRIDFAQRQAVAVGAPLPYQRVDAPLKVRRHHPFVVGVALARARRRVLVARRSVYVLPLGA